MPRIKLVEVEDCTLLDIDLGGYFFPRGEKVLCLKDGNDWGVYYTKMTPGTSGEIVDDLENPEDILVTRVWVSYTNGQEGP